MVESVPIVDTADATILDGRRVTEVSPSVMPGADTIGIDRDRTTPPMRVIDGAYCRPNRVTHRSHEHGRRRRRRIVRRGRVFTDVCPSVAIARTSRSTDRQIHDIAI